MMNFLNNYSLKGREGEYDLSLDILRDLSMVDIDQSQEMRDFEVGYTRSGLLNSAIRPTRKFRDIKESMCSMEPKAYSSLTYRTAGRNPLVCLMANAQREEAEPALGESKDRLYKATIPGNVRHFVVKSPLIRSLIPEHLREGIAQNMIKRMIAYKLLKDEDPRPTVDDIFGKAVLVSRRELHQCIDVWLERRSTALVSESSIQLGTLKIRRTITQEHVAIINSYMRMYKTFMHGVTNIREVTPVRRYQVKKTGPLKFMPLGFANTQMSEFDAKFKPVWLGGTNTEVHPFDFYTIRMATKNRFLDWESRTQTFYITEPKNYNENERLEITLLHSSFLENGCLHFDYVEVHKSDVLEKTVIEKIASSLLSKEQSLMHSWVQAWKSNNALSVAKEQNAAVIDKVSAGLSVSELEHVKSYLAKKDLSHLRVLRLPKSKQQSIRNEGKRFKSPDNYAAYKWTNVKYPDGFSTMDRDEALRGHMRSLDITTLVNQMINGDGRGLGAGHGYMQICNFFSAVCRKINYIKDDNRKGGRKNIFDSVFTIDGGLLKHDKLMTLRRTDTTDPVRMSMEEDQYGSVSRTECNIKQNGVWHHYITTLMASESKTVKMKSGIGDAYFYKEPGEGTLPVVFVSLYGYVFLSLSGGFHPIFRLCRDLLKSHSELVINSVNLPLMDHVTLAFWEAIRMTDQVLVMDSLENKMDPNPDYDEDDTEEETDKLNTLVDQSISYDSDEGDYSILYDMLSDSDHDEEVVEDSSDSLEEKVKSIVSWASDVTTSMSEPYEELPKDAIDNSNAWDSGVHACMSCNPAVLTVKRDVANVMFNGIPIMATMTHRKLRLRFPGFENTPLRAEVDANAGGYRSVSHVIFEYMVRLNETSYNLSWLSTYIWHLLSLSKSTSSELRLWQDGAI
jgi:hypothetical protein